jgi:hypothetical protein
MVAPVTAYKYHIGDILTNLVFLIEKYFLEAEKGQIGPSILKSLMSIPLRKGSVFDSFNLNIEWSEFLLLNQICQQLQKGFYYLYIDCLIETVCIVAFFAFLLCGEFRTNGPKSLSYGPLPKLYQHW